MNRRTLLSAALSCLAAPWVKWGAGERVASTSAHALTHTLPPPAIYGITYWLELEKKRAFEEMVAAEDERLFGDWRTAAIQAPESA
jgi:hypothetical protein